MKDHPEMTYTNQADLIGSCNRNTYKSIYLYIDTKYYEINPYTYVLDYNSGSPGWCTIAIADSYNNFWLLGDTFLRNFYTIWDDSNRKLGIVPHKTSNASIITNAVLPIYKNTPVSINVNTDDPVERTLLIIILSVAVVVCLVVLIVGVVCGYDLLGQCFHFLFHKQTKTKNNKVKKQKK
jgi:hypothetical protein